MFYHYYYKQLSCHSYRHKKEANSTASFLINKVINKKLKSWNNNVCIFLIYNVKDKRTERKHYPSCPLFLSFFHLRFCFGFSFFFFLKELAELVKRDYSFFESKF